MRYEVKALPVERFNHLRRIVHATVRTSRLGEQRIVPKMAHVTDKTYKTMPGNMHAMAKTKGFNGLTHTWFKHTIVWVNPELRGHTLEVTMLHELCHAYNLDSIGCSADAHGPKWRRLFGMALLHYLWMDEEPDPMDDHSALVAYVIRYRALSALDGDEKEMHTVVKAAKRQHERVKERVACGMLR